MIGLVSSFALALMMGLAIASLAWPQRRLRPTS